MTGKNGKSVKTYHFDKQEFIITIDTLKFIPNNTNDYDYFDEYYKLYKVTNTKQK